MSRDQASRVISMFGIFLLAVLAGSGCLTFFAARAVVAPGVRSGGLKHGSQLLPQPCKQRQVRDQHSDTGSCPGGELFFSEFRFRHVLTVVFFGRVSHTTLHN